MKDCNSHINIDYPQQIFNIILQLELFISHSSPPSTLYQHYYYCYYYWYAALGPVWAETRVQSGDWYGSGTLHPGQVLRGSLPLLSPVYINTRQCNSYSRLKKETSVLVETKKTRDNVPKFCGSYGIPSVRAHKLFNTCLCIFSVQVRTSLFRFVTCCV